MKLLLSITLLLFNEIGYCQTIDATNLDKAIREYEISENIENKDSLWNAVLNTFEKLLELKNYGEMKTQNRYNENNLGYEFITVSQYSSENKIFTTHSLSNGFGHWNYVTLKNDDSTNKIILEKVNSSDYYTEIHELNTKEFLLFTRFDDMSFSCYYAFVMKLSDDDVIRQDAFKNEQDFFSVCSWTNVDESYSGEKDPKTGLYMVEGGTKYYVPIQIFYNPKNKTISYSFTKLNNGKKTTRKAKYKNGKFIIKDYDARTFEE